MVYTVTFNPALDYVVTTKDFVLGETNRTKGEELLFGGKGINVSYVLKEFGVPSIALGFLAGFTGKELEKRIKKLKIATNFVYLKNGLTRINIKIKGQKETELNGLGPTIDNKALNRFFKKLNRLKKGDYLVLAGSIPPSLPLDIYETIVKKMSDKGVKTVVDASGDLLRKTLKYKPFLIKPNKDELAKTLNCSLNSLEDVEKAAITLKSEGVQNVLVSMAAQGAILVCETGQVYRITPPKGKEINSVGAGDSMVAGFLAEYIKSGNYEQALKWGTAAGSATAFSQGLACLEDIKNEFCKM